MTVAWRHVTDRFRGFLDGLQPEPGDRARVVAAVRDVGLLLRRRFPPAGQGDPGAPLVIGGYGKDTAICRTDAIDALFVLPDRSATAGAGAFVLVSPTWRRLVVEMATVLAARYGAVDSDPDGWLGVIVRGDGGVRTRVRVLPAFPCAAAAGACGYLVPAGGCRGGFVAAEGWRQFNPLAELAHLNRADAATAGKARDLVRMARAWRRAGRVPLAPFALELLSCEFLSVWLYHRRSTFFYDWMVRDFFFWLSAQEGRTLAVPGSANTIPSGEGWRQAAERAYALAGYAADLERDNRGLHAAACWRLVFGDDFPLARAPDRAGRALPLLALTPATAEAVSVSP